jgi:hypothetical protein
MLGAALAALLLVCFAASVRSSAAAKKARDEQRAIPMVQDCLGKMGLLDRGVKIDVETMHIPLAERPTRKFWVAECADLSGAYLAYVLVDCQRGEIVAVTCTGEHRKAAASGPLDRSGAIAEAARLARRCTPVSALESLSLDGEPVRNGDMWYVPMKSGRRSISVSLQASTGAVLALNNDGPTGA